jgi:hypothetical protein
MRCKTWNQSEPKPMGLQTQRTESTTTTFYASYYSDSDAPLQTQRTERILW